MIKLHPEFLEKKGKKEFAAIPYDEYRAIEDLLIEIEDLIDLRNAKKKEKRKKAIPLAEVKKILGI